MGGLVGLARLPVPTDKDLLFLIDISYSMDEIAGYEDGMDPIDQRDNRELTRRLDVAGAELGALTISLMWNTKEDLDLHVINPNGDRIWYKKRKDKSTGELDVDMNAAEDGAPCRLTREPVENVYWQDPLTGRYEIVINSFENNPDDDDHAPDYVVRVKQPGNMTFYRGRPDRETGKAEYGRLRGPSIIFDYPMHPDWKGGTRITNATNNALTIYDKFTTTEDHIGLIWFNEKSHEEMPLQPRRHPHRDPARTESGQRSVLDSTRHAVKGGTAFFDALIKAVNKKPRSYNSYLVALTDGADSNSKATCAEAEAAIANSPWTVFIIGLEVDPETRLKCERLVRASAAGIYMHAADAGA